MIRLLLTLAALGLSAWAQDGAATAPELVVDSGTKIPLSLINSVSSRTAAVGDRVYLESVFPVLVNGKVVIPPGSYVSGTITSVKRPGKVKGRGELYLRFDSLTLANGVTRDFRARMGGLEGQNPGQMDKEGKVTSEGGKVQDLKTIGTTTTAGSMAGVFAQSGKAAGIGAAAGAAAGLVGVLLSRGPDAVIERGSVVEMVLDRNVTFREDEVPPLATSGRSTQTRR